MQQRARMMMMVCVCVAAPPLHAMPVSELCGVLDPDTRDWTDGLLSNIFREINKPLPAEKDEARCVCDCVCTHGMCVMPDIFCDINRPLSAEKDKAR